MPSSTSPSRPIRSGMVTSAIQKVLDKAPPPPDSLGRALGGNRSDLMVNARNSMYFSVLAVVGLSAALVACTPASSPGLSGAVAPSADAERGGWSVEAWSLGDDGPTSIATDETSGEGDFTLDLGDPDGAVYVQARHGNDTDAA